MSDLLGVGKLAESVEKLTVEARKLLYDFGSPVAKEAGEWLADAIRFRRIVRVQAVIETLRQAQAALTGAGLDAKALELKTLVPLLEQCSLEEEPDMMRRWANLLAAAAAGDPVTPSYVKVLGELTPDEARILDAVARSRRDIADKEQKIGTVLAIEIGKVRAELSIPQTHLHSALINLQHLQLLQRCFSRATFLANSLPLALKSDDFVGLTPFGSAFLEVVSHPPSKALDVL